MKYIEEHIQYIRNITNTLILKINDKTNIKNSIEQYINNYGDIAHYVYETNINNLRYYQRIKSILDDMISISKEYDVDNIEESNAQYKDRYIMLLSQIRDVTSTPTPDYIHSIGTVPYKARRLFDNITFADHNNINVLMMGKSMYENYDGSIVTSESANADRINTYIYAGHYASTYNKKYYYRYIAGTPEQCKISNNAFDIVYSNPSLTIDNICTSSLQYLTINRHERKEIINCLKYIKVNGFFILVIPKCRLVKDISSILAKYLYNVKIQKVDTNNVMITGYRRAEKYPDQELYDRLHNLVHLTDIEDDVIDTINVGIPKEIKSFISTYYSKEMIHDYFKGNTLLSESIRANNENSSINQKKPLLPFSVGQLGLVLTSGCLDGIIDEYDEQTKHHYYHVIKGVVNKKSIKTIDEENNNKLEEETVLNKVNINIIKPNGDRLSLSQV